MTSVKVIVAAYDRKDRELADRLELAAAVKRHRD